MAQVISDCLYRGERSKLGTAVMVHEAPGVHHVLDPQEPAQYDWGRPTPGAQALATRLLNDALGHMAAPAQAESFFLEVVCQLPFMEPWVLWRREIRDWAEGRGKS